MKRPPQNKFLLHGRGIGDLTDDDIENRAREIAMIRGQPEGRVSEEDRNQALAELQGELMPETTESDGLSRGALTRDPSEPVAISGHRTDNYEGENDAEAAERLAREGV
jgi:hypothetical protein